MQRSSSLHLEKKIRKTPHELLSTPTQPVEVFDAALKRQIMKMSFIMHRCEGIGLAANQWGANNSVFIYKMEGKTHACINPIYTPRSTQTEEANTTALNAEKEEKEIGIEGCLSIPDQWLYVPRYKIIDVSYQDIHGNRVGRILEGYEARIYQHEASHLMGKTILDEGYR